MPKISVVIPVYNAEKFLVETLDSVKNQTFTDFECVIVNDGSTDKSLDIVNNYVEQDNRFRVFTIANSGSANVPIIIGVNNAKATMIFILGHDDKLEEICLEKSYKRFIETKADVVLLSMIGCENELEGEMWRLPLDNFDITKTINGFQACAMTIGGWQIPCNGMLVRKEYFESIPLDSYMNSDEYTYRLLLIKANKVVFTNAKYFYRQHTDSISRKFSIKIFDRLKVDKQLDDFVFLNYSKDAEILKRMRNARLFNIVFLYAEFVTNFMLFKKHDRVEIIKMFKYAYRTQHVDLLKIDFRNSYLILFTFSYKVFQICSILYFIYKRISNKKYLYK